MASTFDTVGWNTARIVGAESAKGKTETSALEVMTGVRYSKQKLDAVNGCTFLFDTSTENVLNGKFPIAFFWVKGMEEVMESKMSNKTVILYDEKDTPVTEGGANQAVTQIITDNIIIEPKTYQLDVLVPYSMAQILNSRSVLDMTTDVAIMTAQSTMNATASGALLNFNKSVDIIREVIKALMDSSDTVFAFDLKNKADITSVATSVFSEKDYNKDSLAAMWKSRSICLMKTWDGWNFKYVAITSVNLSKNPTDEGVYEGRITVKEVPIMSVKKSSMLNKAKSSSKNVLKAIKQQEFLSDFMELLNLD